MARSRNTFTGCSGRVRSDSVKIGLTISVIVLVVLLAFGVGLVNFEVGYGLALLVVLAAVLIFSRVFRGADESDAPRDWWVMTAGSTSSAILSALFLLRAIVGVVEIVHGSSPPTITYAGTGILLLIAAAYLNSAIRHALARKLAV